MTNLPHVAVTMGDAAGIGPEVIIPAVLDREVRERCRPIVIGDARRLQEAARIVGLSPAFEIVQAPAEASDDETVAVIDLDNVDPSLAWGQLSAAAGEAAYQYVARAAQYAVAHEVQAICTAPLNKAALHLAGHPYPGHTELLAALTGTEEVSMMLSTPSLRVIHVTTHVGLVDAVGLVEPGLVHRTIARGHEALLRAGIEHPRIGVCGINPHAGENGLFGHDEEAQKIAPGVERAVAEGIHVQGPLAADTLFYRAVRGDFDLVVAMYHDQGHAPIKVLGIEAGVNITVGLPVIRTSVDHGTAFDIAGTGRADSASMRTALLQAAEMADRSTAGTR